MRLGFELGYGQQVLGIADEAARNGDRALARQARQDGVSHLQNSSRILSEYERIVPLTGRCADLRDVRTQLDAIYRIDVGDLSGQSRSTSAAWTLAIERIRMLSGRVSSGASQPANPPPTAQGPVNLLPLTSISIEGGIYQVGIKRAIPVTLVCRLSGELTTRDQLICPIIQVNSWGINILLSGIRLKNPSFYGHRILTFMDMIRRSPVSRKAGSRWSLILHSAVS